MEIKIDSKKEAAIAVIRAAAEKYPSTFICRDRIEEFTGGAIGSRHLANLDSLGLGISGAFKIGRRQCYPVESLVEWLISRLECNRNEEPIHQKQWQTLTALDKELPRESLKEGRSAIQLTL